MSKQTVLLLGATGETGASILEGLLADGSFDVSVLVQPSSATKPAVQALAARGLRIVIGDLKAPVPDLAKVLTGTHTLISAISAESQLAQLPLIEAASLAGIKRFVPCAFTTICPPGGVMMLRDEKEVVYSAIFCAKVPYTIVDVGFWHQISFPRLPSGRSDYAALVPIKDIYGDGQAKNLLTDQRDVGEFVARIVKDERTLSKRVCVWGEELSAEEVWAVVERVSGERLERNYVRFSFFVKSPSLLVSDNIQIPKDTFMPKLAAAKAAHEADPADQLKRRILYLMQYHHSKYIRGDNTKANARYLGYLDARELYPEFRPVSFETFVRELLEGRARRPYPEMRVV